MNLDLPDSSAADALAILDALDAFGCSKDLDGMCGISLDITPRA